MEITNKTLALFLVVAVVISLGGAFMSMKKLGQLSYGTSTGFIPSAQGNATLTINTQASIIFVYNLVDFGAGYVNASFNNCTLLINSSNAITATGCVGFNTTTSQYDTFIIMNNGNTYLNVTMNSSDNASTFIGGTSTIAALEYAITNNESGSCLGTLPYNGTWTNIVQYDNPTVCGNLSYIPGSRTLRMGLRVVIPTNSLKGGRTMTFTATGQ